MSDLFNMQWSPTEYAKAAFLAQEAGLEMISRLDLMMIQPKVIVEVGCGLGEVAQALSQRFAAATIYAVDHDNEMLQTLPATHNIKPLLEDAAKLSLPDHSVDLLCANFLLPWVADEAACIREWRRVIAPNGLLMITTLGVETLMHLPKTVLPRLLDMHDLGDVLVQAGFADPVIDTSRTPVRYRDQQRMLQEWRASGMLCGEFEAADLPLEVNFEVVHAHAFAPPPSAEFKADEEGVVRIPLRHLLRRREGDVPT